MKRLPSKYENRHWTYGNDKQPLLKDTYFLHFRPFDDDEVVLSFAPDPDDEGFYDIKSELVSEEFIEASSPEDAMSQCEELVEQSILDEMDYQKLLLDLFRKIK